MSTATTLARPDRITVGERYARATEATDLSVSLERRTGADVLIAAGAAARRVKEQGGADMGLRLYRMEVSGDHTGRAAVVAESAAWLIAKGFNAGLGGGRGRSLLAAHEIAENVVRWRFLSVCPCCEGRRYELVPGTQIMGDKLCQGCQGEGRPPLVSIVGNRRLETARQLADEFDRQLRMVLADMSRHLKGDMDSLIAGLSAHA